MTLILSCATPAYVFQVSDRRLTSFRDPTQVIDDTRNKAVLIGGRLAFGYTGISHVAGEPTDLWLVKELKEQRTQDLARVCEHLRVRASEAFRAMARGLPPGRRQHLRHAFAGVGWVRRPDASSFEPIYLTVSNALDDTGEWRDDPADEFSMRVDGWGEYEGFRIESAGTRLAPIEKKSIWRHLSRLAKKDAGPSAFLRALVDCALFVASRHSTVSCRLLGLCIPRVAVERQANGNPCVVLAAMPAPSHATFIYHSETGVGPVHYGPHAAGDGVAITGVECGSL